MLVIFGKPAVFYSLITDLFKHDSNQEKQGLMLSLRLPKIMLGQAGKVNTRKMTHL